MIPIKQQDFREGAGDCYAACLASILEIPLDQVPHFKEQQNKSNCCMIDLADKWLRKHHRKRLITIELAGPTGSPDTSRVFLNRLAYAMEADEEYVILSGESPRRNANGSTRYHAVVGQAMMWGFKVVHDPHPAGGGLAGNPYAVAWIVPVNRVLCD